MKVLEMEIKIYEELKVKVLDGAFNGRNFYDELKSGNYLKDLDCKNLDKDIFSKAEQNVKANLLDGFETTLVNSNFIMRRMMTSVSFGTFSLNKSFVDGFEPHIERLKTDLEKEKIEEKLQDKPIKLQDKTQMKESAPKVPYVFPDRNFTRNDRLLMNK